MKKKAALILALVLMLDAFMPVSALADNSVALSATLSATTMTTGAGETVSYEIALPVQSNVNNLQLEINYDNTVLEAISTQTLFGKFNDEDYPDLNYNVNGAITPAATANAQGKIILAMAATSTITQTGGAFCRAKFQLKDGVTTDQTSISVTVVKCETGTGANTTPLPCTAPANKTITITQPAVPATAITVEPKTATVERGKTTILTATLTPENSTDTVEWISDKPEIVTVKDGIVTGVKAGSATITAKVVGKELIDTCVVTVTDPMLSGELTISGNAVYGEKLTASLSGYESGVTYTWFRSGVTEAIATGAIYTIGADDIDKTLTVKATHTDFTGEKTASTSIVTKATQAKPAAPEMETINYESITLKTVAGCEYSMNGTAWQASAKFEGLAPNTEYTFYIRYAETATHFASEAASAKSSTNAYGAKDIKFSVKLDGKDVTNYADYISITGAIFLTGKEEGTVTITPKASYYLNGVTVTGASNSVAAPAYPVNTAVEFKLTLNDVDVAASIAIEVNTKTIPAITFKNGGTAINSAITKDYDGSAFELTAESTHGTVELTYYDNAGEEMTAAPVDAGTYTAKATVAGGVTYTAANAEISLTIKKISMGTAFIPTISDVNTTGFTYSTITGQKYIVNESAAAPSITAEGWEDGTGTSVTVTGKEPGTTWYVHTFLPGDKNHTPSAIVSATAKTLDTYLIAVAPTELNFFARVGSTNKIDGQSVTVINQGTGEVKLSSSALTYYDVSGLADENATLAGGASLTLIIVPKGSLSRSEEKEYSENLTVSDANGKASAATVALSFNVRNKETVTFTGFADKIVTYGESYNMEIAVPTPNVALEYEYWKGTEKLTAAPTEAGTYTVKVRVPDANVDYAGEAVAMLIINKKELTVSGLTVLEKVYDGTTAAAVNGGQLNGVVNNEAIGFEITSAEFNSKDVNTAKEVNVTVKLTGDATISANYTLKQPTAIAAKITPKSVELEVTAENKVYDGKTDAEVKAGFAAGDLLEADAAFINISVTGAAFADAHVGSGKPVTYNISITSKENSVAASNYAPSWPESVAANITQRPVTVTFSGEMTATYDGNPKSATAMVNNVVAGDIVGASVLYNGSTNEPVLADSYVLTATLGNADYKLADTPYTQIQEMRTLVIAKGTLIPANMSVKKTIAYLDTDVYNYDLAALFGMPVAGSFTQKNVTDVNAILAQNTLTGGKATIALASGRTVGHTAEITYNFTPAAENTYNPIDLMLVVEVGTETVEKVEIIGAPKEVEIGTELDLAKITMKVTYKSGRTESFDSTKYTASGYSAELKPENVGIQILKLEAMSQNGTHIATEHILVTDVLSGIEMAAQPIKTEYALGVSEIDLTGGKVKLTYKSTAVKTLDLADSALTLSAVTPEIMRQLGEHIVAVTYTEGGVTKETSFLFKVVSGSVVNPGEGGTGPVIGMDDQFLTDPEDITSAVNNSKVELVIRAAKDIAGIDAALKQEYPSLVGKTQNMNMAFMADGVIIYAAQATTVQLPYPVGTERSDSFMFYLYNGGTLTAITPIKCANHLSVELPAGFSESDVMIAWMKYSAPDAEESEFDRAQERFWSEVLHTVAFADSGEVITVDAGYFDQMPVEIMNAVNARNVVLVIRWKYGEDIVIGRANALIPEMNRLYYPLSYLQKMLTKFPVSGSGNIIFAPQTGDDWEITDWSMGMFVAPLSATQNGNAAMITILDGNGSPDLTWLGMLFLFGALVALCAGWYVTNRKNKTGK